MFTQFTELNSEVRKSINRRFILPIDLTKVVVRTKDLIPCEIIGGLKVSCTVKASALIGKGFHNHSTRLNN